MTAIIIDLESVRRRTPRAEPVAPATAFRDRVKHDIAQVVMEDYSDWPWPIVQQAIAAAAARLDADGTFLDAVETAEQVFLDHRAAESGKRDLVVQRRQHRREAFFRQAARTIDDRLRGTGKWLQRHYALVRARRVIDRGGTIGAALRAALGEDWLG